MPTGLRNMSLVLLLVSANALGASARAVGGNLYEWNALPKESQNAAVFKAAQATVAIMLPTHENYFSGTIVSSEGTVIGALHTLANCHGVSDSLFQTLAVRESCTGSNRNYSTAFLRKAVTRGPVPAAFSKVPFAQFKVLTDHTAHEGSIELVFLGAQVSIKANLPTEMSKVASGCITRDQVTFVDDFIVFKLPPRKGGYPCARLSDSSEEIGQQIWEVGYPTGYSGQRFSTGKVDFSEAGNALYEFAVGPIAGYFATDAYGWHGMSGGSVFNERGELLGVISVGSTSTNFTGAVRVDGIRKALKANLGSAAEADLFRCN